MASKSVILNGIFTVAHPGPNQINNVHVFTTQLIKRRSHVTYALCGINAIIISFIININNSVVKAQTQEIYQSNPIQTYKYNPITIKINLFDNGLWQLKTQRKKICKESIGWDVQNIIDVIRTDILKLCVNIYNILFIIQCRKGTMCNSTAVEVVLLG